MRARPSSVRVAHTRGNERDVGDRGEVATRLGVAIEQAAQKVLRGLDTVVGSG